MKFKAKTLDEYCQKTDKSTRFRSLDICHSVFLKNSKNYRSENQELLSLHLMGFLASWGMYRASSPLFRNFDYTVHADLIPILMNKEYGILFDADLKTLSKNKELVFTVYDEIKEYYTKKGFIPSDTLITKILLAVYGCCPAYDRFVRKGLSNESIQHAGTFKNKYSSLLQVLLENENFVKELSTYPINENDYSLMKRIDAYFWQLGH